MAIFHLRVKNISRGKGGNAIASAAYRRATKLFDVKEGCYHNYLNKPGVIHSEITAPVNSPNWAKDLVQLHDADKSKAAELLWNDVERTERRKDSRLAKEIVFALPIELNQEQNIELSREFLKDQFAMRGMIVDWSVHWDEGNPHVHVMTTTRKLIDEGFGKKVREWNSKDLIKEWRLQWSAYANFYLRMYEYDSRIDHRSYADQGIDLIPSIHVGKAVTDMHRRGIPRKIMEQAKEVHAENLARIAANPNILFNKMMTQRDSFSREQLGQELGRYVNDQGKFSITSSGILAEKVLTEMKGLEEVLEKNSVLTPDVIAMLLKSLEHHDSVFSERDIAKALSAHTDNADAFAKALLEIKASKALLYLGAGRDGRDRYTTRRMFKLENNIQNIADVLRERKHIHISDRLVIKILDNYKSSKGKGLTDEQRAAVMHLVQNASIACMVGRAGTGKSFTLGAAKAVWEAKKLRVIGVALSGVAADGLTTAGIPSSTIDSFRYALERGSLSLGRNDVVVMDEAGMSDSFSMNAVLAIVKTSGAKLVLVGDHAQLQPVGPGAVFRALVERLGFKELQTIHRQEEQWQRDATVAFSKGHIAVGLAAYESNNCLYLEKTEQDSAIKLVQNWQVTRSKSSKDISNYLVMAHRNEDVSLLNHLLREERLAAREIESGYSVSTTQGDISIAAGERLLFLKNDNRLGVKNGRFATVKSLELGESGRVLRFTVVLDDSGKEVTVDTARYQDFMHGYAATIHKAQGLTVDHSWVYASGFGWNKHLTYVAMTRHRHTCQLYADKATYKDMDGLNKQLGRFALKDSLLDFPLGFAERRGIEVKGLASFLTALRDKIRDQYELSTNPEAYWRKRAEKIQELGKYEDARKVASYVDANQVVGKAWQELRSRLDMVGVEEFSYEPKVFELISATQEYQRLREATLSRNSVASDLLKDISKYEDAIAIHQLDISKLKKQANNYICHERIIQYATLNKMGNVVLRDRVAAEISRDMKGHYSHISAQNLSVNEIRTQGRAHQQRQMFIHLTPEERETFRVVQSYQLLSKAVGEQWKAQTALSSARQLIKRSDAKRFEKITEKREALAFDILSNRNRYDKALDFYQIGGVTPSFSDENRSEGASLKSEKVQKFAEARWFKLQQAAGRYELKDRVRRYHKALFVGDTLMRRELASQILRECRAHFGAITNLGLNTREIMNSIKNDAKKYERDQFFQKLDLVEKEAFERVEAYVDLKKTTSDIWKEIFNAKENMGLSGDKLLAQFDSAFSGFSAKARLSASRRDSLAATIFEDLTTHEKALIYFGITSHELDKASYRQMCDSRISEYINCQNSYEKSQLAFEITRDPKAHYSSMVEKGLEWRQIYRDAKIAEQEALFARLPKEEKMLLRLVSRYQKVNREVGQVWSELLKNKSEKVEKTQKTKFIKPSLKAEGLLAKRDYYAEKLYSQKEKLEYMRLFDGDSIIEGLDIVDKNKGLVWNKIEKQAHNHKERVNDVQDWAEIQQKSAPLLKQLLISLENSSSSDRVDSSNSAIYKEWKTLQEEAIKLGSDLQSRFANYQYALLEVGYAPEKFERVQSIAQKGISSLVFSDFSALLEKSVSGEKYIKTVIDSDVQNKLEAVQRIVSGTKPIRGTLAERYLREHRGIQGKIDSKTFGFHPNLRNWVKGGYYPALIVLVRDEKDQKNVVCGVQAIFLDPETANKSTKLEKGAVKLSRGKVGDGAKIHSGIMGGKVAFAEGPETALSVAEAHPEWTVYATFSSTNFDKVPLRAKSPSVVICADNDGEGSSSHKSVVKAAEKLSQNGIEVWVTTPEKPLHEKKWDFNDALLQRGKDAVRVNLDQMKLLREAKSIEKIKSQMKVFAQELKGAFIVSRPIKASDIKSQIKVATNPLDNLYGTNKVSGFTSLKAARSAQIQAWLQQNIKSTSVKNLESLPSVLIARDKKEACVLNERAYQSLVDESLLKTLWSIKTPYGWRDLSEGGRVRFGEAYPEKRIPSEMLGTITAVKRRSLNVDVNVKLDDGREITFNPNDYSAIDYGYALTIQQRRAQKETKVFDVAHVLISKSMQKEELVELLKIQPNVTGYWLNADFDDLGAVKNYLVSPNGAEINVETPRKSKEIESEIIQEAPKENKPKKENDFLIYLKEGGIPKGYELLTDAREAQVKTWLDVKLKTDGHEHLLVGNDSKEVKTLNERAHALFKHATQIKPDGCIQTAYGWREIGEGVHVRFGKEYPSQKIKADTLGVIDKIERDVLKVRLEDGRSVKFKLKEYSDLDYGYAIGLDKAYLKPMKCPHVLVTKSMDMKALKALLDLKKEVQCYWRKIEFDSLKGLKKHLGRAFKIALNKNHDREVGFDSKLDYDF
jgi:ATP-dependent exoDNAse (exonuclease V) alpha subunit